MKPNTKLVIINFYIALIILLLDAMGILPYWWYEMMRHL